MRLTTLGLLLAMTAIGCADVQESTPRPAEPTFEQGVEHMPGPASVWLTSDPATLKVAVPVTMTTPSEPTVRFAHTFVAGAPIRGSFATSQGVYQLAAFDGTCTLDLTLGPSQAAEVVLRLDDAGCSLELRRLGGLDDPAMWHDDGAILITNGGANETPFIEPTAQPT